MCRRKQRESKKHNKEIQAERQKEKAQAKKRSIDSVTKLRRQRQKSGFAGELDMDAELAQMDRPKISNASRISQSTLFPSPLNLELLHPQAKLCLRRKQVCRLVFACNDVDSIRRQASFPLLYLHATILRILKNDV